MRTVIADISNIRKDLKRQSLLDGDAVLANLLIDASSVQTTWCIGSGRTKRKKRRQRIAERRYLRARQ